MPNHEDHRDDGFLSAKALCATGFSTFRFWQYGKVVDAFTRGNLVESWPSFQFKMFFSLIPLVKFPEPV